jgi:hypothetical protein
MSAREIENRAIEDRGHQRIPADALVTPCAILDDTDDRLKPIPPPVFVGKWNRRRRVRNEPAYRAERGIKPSHQRVAAVCGIELESLRQKHGRAAARRAGVLREAKRRTPQPKHSAGPAVRFAGKPKSVSVAPDEEKRNRPIKDARIRPVRQRGRWARSGAETGWREMHHGAFTRLATLLNLRSTTYEFEMTPSPAS